MRQKKHLNACPDIARDESMRRRMAALAWLSGGISEETRLFAAGTLGPTVDLDASGADIDVPAPAELERRLRELSEGRTLVMSRDHVNPKHGASALRALLSYVTFRPPSLPVGVSGLTAALLKTKDPVLLRRALKLGLIPAEEPAEELLALASRNPELRALLLTHKRPALCVPGAGPDADDEAFGLRRILREEDEERILTDPALRGVTPAPLLDTICRSAMERREYLPRLNANGFMAVDHIAYCALRGETETVLRFVPRVPCRCGAPAPHDIRPENSPDKVLMLTLLGCAAAGGQAETVRALLDRGLDPDERDLGRLSLTGGEGEHFTVPPLLAAVAWARWDTAELLLERGAVCDLTSRTARLFFAWLGADVPYGDVLQHLRRFERRPRVFGGRGDSPL